MSKKPQDKKNAELPAENNLPSAEQSDDVDHGMDESVKGETEEPKKKEDKKPTKQVGSKELKLPKKARFLINTGVSLPMEDGTYYYMAFIKKELIEDTALVEKLFALNLSTSVVIFE